MEDDLRHETPEDRQGKMLLHTEYSLLSLLHDQDGIVHHHGLFQVAVNSDQFVNVWTGVFKGAIGPLPPLARKISFGHGKTGFGPFVKVLVARENLAPFMKS